MLWKQIFRICRFSKYVFFEWATEPVFNRGLILALVAPAITLSFYRYFFGEDTMMEELNSLIIGTITFIGSYLIYLLIGLFCAPFIAYKKEKEKGSFFGKRFVYHNAYHIYTTIIKPEDHEQTITFVVKDAEPYSLVCFDFKYRGGLGYVSVMCSSEYVKNSTQAANLRNQQLTLRLDKQRNATLKCCTAPNSDDTILGIYMLSWEY
ncbi:hypothetical protein [Legionella hackeliae]|uniref:Uncharacterized protein n=1 Tax=Legionella hackeliae TaxID=449 RepID=A0A0A8ULC4_LEGHA|nr:hypothetical protein [Legionella hackeliae]KTD10142.1 hypothetical protein Lhac_2510 [Legionella hackeliae]CEK09635.1 protein of unknown function [Legionella hackeliae]STX49547.1 Uncharacterised protein [Legionella hackeliae]